MESAPGVIGRQRRQRIDAGPTQARCRPAIDEGAGIVLRTVNAIGVGSQRRNGLDAVNGDGKGEEELGVAPAPSPLAAQGHGGFPA